MRIVTGVDIETTGLAWSKGHRIVEIAALVYNLDTEALLGTYVQRINPQRPIEPKALEVHGISFESVAHLPPLETFAPKIAEIIRLSKILVTFNGEHFDVPFINAELARVGQPVPPVAVIDTMLQARWATPLGKNPNLGELCFACNVPYDPEQAHAADYDVRVMMQCFFHGYRRGFFSLPVTQPATIAA